MDGFPTLPGSDGILALMNLRLASFSPQPTREIKGGFSITAEHSPDLTLAGDGVDTATHLD